METGSTLWSNTLEVTRSTTLLDDLVITGGGLDNSFVRVGDETDGRLHFANINTGEPIETLTFRAAIAQPAIDTTEGLLVSSSDPAVTCN